MDSMKSSGDTTGSYFIDSYTRIVRLLPVKTNFFNTYCVTRSSHFGSDLTWRLTLVTPYIVAR